MQLTEHNRREFLERARALAIGALVVSPAGWLEACSSSPTAPAGTSIAVGTAATTGTVPGSVPVATTSTIAAGPVNFQSLASSMQGSVALPGQPGWSMASVVYNTVFDGIVPQAVAFCQSPQDVQTALHFARDNGLELRARNGRHSYAGYSTCPSLVIDVSRMNTVTVGPSATSATIGAGAVLIDVYTELAAANVGLPGGTCPTVGITGLTLGGGIGEAGRKWGTTSDNLTSIQIVTAAGDVLTADANNDADLFWACRGGGGGNFGIATELTFAVHPVSSVTTFSIAWPWVQAPAVVAAWQELVQSAPDELFTGCSLLTQQGSTTPLLETSGTWLGTPGQLQPVLAPLLASGSPTSNATKSQSWLNAMRYWAGCSSYTQTQCHNTDETPGGVLPRNTWKAKSAYVNTTMPAAGVHAIMHWVEQRQNDAMQPTAAGQFQPGGVLFDSYGGAINRVPADATAFVHRDALFHMQFAAYWNPTSPADLVQDNLTWIAGFYNAMGPWASGEAYQNYIDPDLPNWQQAYYGANLPKLQAIKKTYDPTNVFQFAQSIPPAS